MAKARIAVLFDAENIAPKYASEVLAGLAEKGQVTIKVAVGDLTKCLAWIDTAKAHGIQFVHQPCLGKGKNSSDIALAIEAMDILQGRTVDAFAIVSSDRDFTPLATRLIRGGTKVFGFGKVVAEDTPFSKACTTYDLVGGVSQQTISQQATIPPPPAIALPKLSQQERDKLNTFRPTKNNGSLQAVDWCRLGSALRATDAELHKKVGGGKRLKKVVTLLWTAEV